MAMEVSRPAKGLTKHVLPIVMIAVALMLLPIAAIAGSQSAGLNIGGQPLAGGLTRHLLSVRPTTNGLAEVTLDDTAGTDASRAGSYLDQGPVQAGQQTALWLQLQK